MSRERFPEAERRLFHRKFICMKCGARIKTDMLKVQEGKVKCRKCKSKRLRPLHKDLR